MEPSKEAISIRMARIWNLFAGSANNKGISTNKHTLTRDGLLDALIVLYNEYNQDNVKKLENVSLFIEKFRGIMVELRSQRVNLSDFHVQTIIGRGHFGEVQIVKEKHTGDIYAMKTLKKNSILKNPSAAFYEEERDIMANTTSPWLTSLQYAFQDLSNLYLVMEYLPGGDMLTLLDHYGNKLSEDMATFYLAELALAIKSLHSMGYVHRDIKPGNILLDRCGHIKLADFGTAAKLTAAGCVISMMAVGTPEYIAPEILQVMENNDKGKKGSYGIECDYWSLGIVAFELVIGRTPFGGSKLPDIYQSIMNHSTALKLPVNDSYSSAFLDLVAKLLTQSSLRIGAEKLANHSFFKSIVWNNLRDMVPPHVPMVTSDDDSSNFPKLSRLPQAPCPEDYQTRLALSGRDLPFIGFTFTHGSVLPSHDNKDLDASIAEIPRKESKKEVDDLLRKLALAKQQGNDKNNKWESATTELESKLRLLQGTEALSKKLEQDYQRSQKENVTLKRYIESSKEERRIQEEKAISLIRDMKAKLARKYREEESRLTEELEMLKSKLAEQGDLYGKLFDKVQKQELDLIEARKENVELQAVSKANDDRLCKVRQSVRQSICGNDRQLEQLNRAHKEKIDDLEQRLAEEKNARKESDALRQADKLIADEIETELTRAEAQLKTKTEDNRRLTEKNEKLVKELAEVRASWRQDLSKKKDAGQKEMVELQLKLSTEQARCAELKNRLTSIESELNESVIFRESHEMAVSARHAEREQQIADLNKLLKQASEEKGAITLQLQEALEKEANESMRSSSLEVHLEEIRQSLRRLEEENASLKVSSTSEYHQMSVETDIEKQVLEAQIKKLDAQLEKLREQSVLDRNTKVECETKLSKIEKELSHAKIDIRIAEREAKGAREEIKLLSDEKKSRQLKALGDKNAHAQEVAALSEKINEHLQEALELRKKLDKSENDTAIFRLVTDEAKAKLAEKVEELSAITLKMKANDAELRKERENVRILESRINSMMGDVKEANKTYNRALDEKRTVADSLHALQLKYDGALFNIEQLKMTCSELDEELEGYTKKIESLEAKIESLTKDKTGAEVEISRLQSELSIARQAVNEEKSLKLKTEMRIKALEGDLVASNEEASALETKSTDYKKMAEHLTIQVSNLELACVDTENQMESEKRKNMSLLSELNALKEELAKYLTQIQSLKDSNHSLSCKLECCEEGRETLKQSLEKLRADFQEQEVYNKQREYKTNAQLKQQVKLIEYLQKQGESRKKPKTFTEKLFGSSKENVTPNGLLGSKELECLLTQERTKNLGLNDKLMKAQAELAVLKNDRIVDAVNMHTTKNVIETPRTKQAVVALSQPNDQPDFERKTSTMRMRHNIPHRFEQRLCMRATKCAACLDSVHFGRSAATCLECGVQAHSKCSLLLPHACGLPLAFARHYSRAPANGSGDNGTAERDGEHPVRMEGYVKLPTRGNSCWERRYLMLEGSTLKAYEHEPTAGMMPVETLEICTENGVPSISIAVPHSGVVNTAESDLPYLIKVTVTPLTTCWPDNSMLIMTLGFPDKQAWASALEEVIQHSKTSLTGTPRNRGTVILTTPRESLDINCVLQLSSDLLLIGATEGLFSLRTSTPGAVPVKISGVTDVHQIALVPAVRLALMIAGNSRELVQCELGQLTSSAEARNASIMPTAVLKPTTVKAASCHLFAVATTTDSNGHSRTTLCAATADKLVLLTWSVNSMAFNVIKTLETAEPCSCIHFAPHSIILGCDKFFEIDLRDFSADEFLDPSDKSLSHACYGARQLSSFPIAIIDVSAARGKTEYLVAFNEFGVFVDKFGQRSRNEDVKWSHMPFAFSYRKPYLFIFHFSSVEVMKLGPDSFTRDPDDSVATVNYPGNTFIEMNSPKMLGISTGSESVFVSHLTDRSALQLVAMGGKHVFKDDIGFSCSSLDTVQTKDTADLNTDFSFTSSLVQSLDGSEAEEENFGRRVHFNGQDIMHTEL